MPSSISLSTVLHSGEVFNTGLKTTSIALGTKSCLVSVIQNSPGLIGTAFIVGFIFGVMIVHQVNYRSYIRWPITLQEHTLCEVGSHSSEKREFQLKGSSFVIKFSLSCIISAAFAVWVPSNRLSMQSRVFSCFLTVGLILGAQMKEYYTKNSYQKISQFLQKVEKNELNLTETDLTNNDLEQMATSGCFSGLEVLVLRRNPQITSRGLASIAESGFEGLKSLDISGNTRLFERLDGWMSKSGLKSLESLDLSEMDIRENQLLQMIEKPPWIENLRGLNLSWNANLRKLPYNISELKNLNTHSVSADQISSCGPIHFRQRGLFIRGCNISGYNVEMLKLVQERKIYGDDLMYFRLVITKKDGQNFQQLCKIANIEADV